MYIYPVYIYIYYIYTMYMFGVYTIALYMYMYNEQINMLFMFSGRFTPSGGGRSRRPAAASGGVIGRGNSSSRGGRGDSKPSSRGASEEPSASSESESSENEAEMLKAQVMPLHVYIVVYTVHNYLIVDLCVYRCMCVCVYHVCKYCGALLHIMAIIGPIL